MKHFNQHPFELFFPEGDIFLEGKYNFTTTGHNKYLITQKMKSINKKKKMRQKKKKLQHGPKIQHYYNDQCGIRYFTLLK